MTVDKFLFVFLLKLLMSMNSKHVWSMSRRSLTSRLLMPLLATPSTDSVRSIFANKQS